MLCLNKHLPPFFSTAPAYKVPITFALKQQLQLLFIKEVASSQNLRKRGGIMLVLKRIIARFFRFVLGSGQHLIGNFPGLAKVQHVRSPPGQVPQ